MKFALAATAFAVLSGGCASLLGLEETSRATSIDGGVDEIDAMGAPPGLYSLSLDPAAPRVVVGSVVDVTVNISRGENFNGDVSIALADLPNGVTATTAAIADGEPSATISLTITPAAAHGLADVRLVGTSTGEEDVELPIPLLVAGNPGDLDLSFNLSGSLLESGADLARRVIVAPSGRIYVAAKLGTTGKIFAFNQDGSPDTAFASDGELSVIGFDIFDIAIHPNGIAAAGIASGQLTVKVYTDNGGPYAVFGGAGSVSLQPAMFGSSEGRALAVLSDSTIIVAGQEGNGMTGMLIPFSNVGAVGSFINFDGTPYLETTRLDSVALQGDDTIIAGGDGPGGAPQPILIRATYNPGEDSWAVLHAEAARNVPNRFNRLDVHTNDKVVHIGNSMTGNGDFYVERYDSTLMTSEHLDTADVALSGSSTNAWGVSFAADGKYVVTAEGCSNGCMDQSAALLRYLAAGDLDMTFADAGKLIFDGSSVATDFYLRDVTVQADGRILAAGEQDGQLWLLRVWD